MTYTGENYTTARHALLINDVRTRRDHPESVDDADRRFYDATVRAFFDGRRLRAIPSRRRARVIVLLELMRRFARGRLYSESEVSTLLAEAHEDWATLRRELVNYGT